jgi:hypothetical protein
MRRLRQRHRQSCGNAEVFDSGPDIGAGYGLGLHLDNGTGHAEVFNYGIDDRKGYLFGIGYVTGSHKGCGEAVGTGDDYGIGGGSGAHDDAAEDHDNDDDSGVHYDPGEVFITAPTYACNKPPAAYEGP